MLFFGSHIAAHNFLEAKQDFFGGHGFFVIECRTQLTFLAKAFPDADWEGFHKAVDSVTPKCNRTPLLPFMDEDVRPDSRKATV